MAEIIKTEKEIYTDELNKIAQKSYGRDYYGLCGDRQKVVRRLYAVENAKVRR